MNDATTLDRPVQPTLQVRQIVPGQNYREHYDAKALADLREQAVSGVVDLDGGPGRLPVLVDDVDEVRRGRLTGEVRGEAVAFQQVHHCLQLPCQGHRPEEHMRHCSLRSYC